MGMHTMMRNDVSGNGDRIGGRTQRRAGLSVLEAVGCVMAVVGGAWLGAICLGIDVRQLAHTALAESALLDKVPEDWRPAGAEESRMTREQLVATLREELGVLRAEIGSLRSKNDEPSDAATAGAGSATGSGGASDARIPSHEKTLAYWTRLNEITLGEVALQHDAESAFDDQNAAKVFSIKGRINRFAAKAVEAIPHEGVEPSVVQFGRQLSVWYERAGELNEKAVQIWETSAGNQGRALLNEAWSRDQVQHRNEARLLNERAGMVRGVISRQFSHEFPEFVQPQAGSTPGDKANG